MRSGAVAQRGKLVCPAVASVVGHANRGGAEYELTAVALADFPWL
jgi:hypothetical protein